MNIYRVTIDGYDRRKNHSDRVTILLVGYSPKDAVAHLGTVYASKDGRVVNATGGVGSDGYAFSEWSVVSIRKSRAAHHNR